jgi:hypothetical protein
MNRAWIPAGALAGVSVAGLIALGPLTDPLGTPVPFPVNAAVPQLEAAVVPASVPVNLTLGTTGSTHTQAAVLSLGGRQSSASSTEGPVALKLKPPSTVTSPSSPPATSVTATQAAPPPATAKPKKVVKRQTSLGASGETNSDQGLAGPTDTTSAGSQSSTPAP